MPKEKISKTETKETIENFFNNLGNKTPREVKKIKKLAMRYNIKLGKNKRLFCKKCFSVFNSSNRETRIKKGFKIIKCKNCGYINRYKLN